MNFEKLVEIVHRDLARLEKNNHATVESNKFKERLAFHNYALASVKAQLALAYANRANKDFQSKLTHHPLYLIAYSRANLYKEAYQYLKSLPRYWKRA